MAQPRRRKSHLIAKTLTSKLSRNIYLHRLTQLEETVVESDCRDKVPVTGVEELRQNNNDLLTEMPLVIL